MSNSTRKTSVQAKTVKKISKGFTLIELMVGVSIMGIIAAIALPNLGEFLIKMRVDNEVSELQRLILTTRNTAVNMGQTTIMCPLNASNTCTDNWDSQLSVFIDVNDNLTLDDGETLVKFKEAIKSMDQLQYTNDEPLIYEATGFLSTTNGNFIYCPEDDANLNRGISIGASGRARVSSDLDDDDIDEFMVIEEAGTTITSIVCS